MAVDPPLGYNRLITEHRLITDLHRHHHPRCVHVLHVAAHAQPLADLWCVYGGGGGGVGSKVEFPSLFRSALPFCVLALPPAAEHTRRSLEACMRAPFSTKCPPPHLNERQQEAYRSTDPEQHARCVYGQGQGRVVIVVAAGARARACCYCCCCCDALFNHADERVRSTRSGTAGVVECGTPFEQKRRASNMTSWYVFGSVGAAKNELTKDKTYRKSCSGRRRGTQI
jgi:hypothetical protein